MKSRLLLAHPFYLLHAEALCFLAAACGAYHLLFPHHWFLFACMFLIPDLSLLLYLPGPSAAASLVYNGLHSYVPASLAAMLAVLLQSALLGQLSLIWMAHISLDRTFGYGLKYAGSFRFTHIQSTANPAAALSSPAS